MTEWTFYGRTGPISDLTRILGAERWFFCRIEGRRRIGKTALLTHLSGRTPDFAGRLVYMQVPDSDERDVAGTFRRALAACDHPDARAAAPGVTDFPSMASAVAKCCRAGLIVVIDEFQYFTRSALFSFNSFLQSEIDVLRSSGLRKGGLFVLGSLHSDMNALLDDRGAPLYGRLTQRIRLEHWDFEDLMQVFRAHGVEAPSQWLTAWTFFEGIPKFYHDAYEQDLFAVEPAQFADELLSRMFLRSSSPLSEEADTWFLRELRGRALSVLGFLAEHAGCNNGEILAGVGVPEDKAQISTYLTKLVSHYEMVAKLNPVFSDGKSRNARYYIADNFLQAWLAVAKPARELARIKSLPKSLQLAAPRLQAVEGVAFEKLVRKLHLECSRKGVGDFELSSMQLGFWNRPRDESRSIEIDIVALDAENRRVRFGSCKRSAKAHTRDSLEAFETHIAAFLASRDHRELSGWHHERVLFAPEFSTADRRHFKSGPYLLRDLGDYAKLF